MRKYITCLIGILCIAFTSVCFAGRNELTSFSGELISVSVIDKDGKEYPIPGASGHIDLSNVINAHATVGEDGDLPNGEYTAIKYVFKNEFHAAGRVILDDGTVYGSTGGFGSIGGPVFKKNQTPTMFDYDYQDGGADWGWCTANVSGGKLEVIETDDEAHFTLDENTTKTFTVGVQLKWLWFGGEPNTDMWADFSSSTYIKPAADVTPGPDNKYFGRIDDDTICAPMIDPPEMEKVFN